MKAAKIVGVAILILIGVILLPATRDTLKWHFASSGDKAQNYAEYLATWPSGRHSNDAHLRYDERSWADAQAGKTLESYRQYEQTHPSGTHLAEARTQIEDLTWQLSTNANTIQSFEAYLKSYDMGRFADVARTRIEELTWQQSTNANTVRSLRAYAEAYPKGRFVAESQQRQDALRTDDAPYTTALQKDMERALSDFLTEYPGHAREADAKQAIKDITEGRDIVDLLAEKKVEVQTQGSGIESVSVRVRRLVPYPLTIRVPVGSFFVSASQSAQNMVSTAESKVRLTTDSWQSISVDAACANRPRDIPSGFDTFTVQRSPQQAELAKLMPVLDKARVDSGTKQAAVWIVTDNANYDELGILVVSSTGFGGSRVINHHEAARAMKVCTEAGIDITRKRIWSDQQTILRGLSDADLKKWLEQEASEPKNSGHEVGRDAHAPEQRRRGASAGTGQAQTAAPLEAEPESSKRDGATFLAANAKKEGVKITASGLQYEVIKSGSGPSPRLTDRVKVHYHGTLIDGTVFDSSVRRGEPATFPVSAIIPGWTEALQLMKTGDKWRLFIPPDLAFGKNGVRGVIGPNSTLLFEVELLGIEK